ncbi:MAG: D-2-hydroxyacid dehydrogenase [Pseudomonadota bacterium]
MKTLLCHRATFARIESRLKALTAALQPICIDDNGALSAPDGGPAEPGQGYDLVFANTDAFFSPSVSTFARTILQAPHIGWVQSSAAGIEHPMLQAIGAKADHYTTGHEQSPAIAEWVLWAAFDYFQNGTLRRAQQAGETWKRIAFREIAGSRWLIVGYGAIGEETGKRLTALGAHVTGLRRRPGPADGAAEIHHPDALIDCLPQVDGVVLSAPLTDETRYMINAAALAAMKPDAILINVARGGLVDEPALLDALDRGVIGHAALDVVETEPLPPGHRFWQHPKITLTPHIAATTAAAVERTDGLFIDNLSRLLAGEPLRNRVDKAAFQQAPVRPSP